MRSVFLGVCSLLVAGCTATYQSSPIPSHHAKLVRGKTLLIATPVNGSYEGREYANSGNMTASALRSAFGIAGGPAEVSVECRDLACLRGVPSRAADYYVVPEILHWEDRSTEWSGAPDRIEIKVAVFASDGTEIASTIITGKSKWATFGGDHPQDLLPKPLGDFVNSIY